MMELLDLSNSDFLLLCLIAFAAGLVRGFSGFALSAIVVAAGALVLPPVALIPICWWLEMTASALMVKGGWREADRHVVFGLAFGSMIGVPIGLALTTSLPEVTSKVIALSIVIVLALTLLARIRIAFLATKAGLYGSGLTAGIVTGLSGVGGMIVAIYVLAQDTAARQMRAALVLFLFIGSVTSFVTYLLYGIMDQTAVVRGLSLVVPTGAGVLIGTALFNPTFEPYYKPFCLSLLVLLGATSLLRLAL